ncbi:TetR-like C-terminal domain-containing protein [uncultured Nocardioides sp.]|uniref:TetR/AcrR family transcriptional regulator n=1 Tax=uncultured Nocardioides sp. TaxID=198441 RepID=UPI002630FF64|nr:TetR-like C-terminal domain-containing protein [uncultured Nocardioides sp.]
MTATPHATHPFVEGEPAAAPGGATDADPGDRLALVARVVGVARTELCQRHHLSIRAVARRAGVDPRDVARHVGSGDELIRRIFFEIAVDAHEAMAATSRVPAASSCRDRLLGYARGYRHWALSNPVEFSLVLGPTSRPLMTETVAAEGVAWFYGPLLDILRDGHARGQIDTTTIPGGRAQPGVRPALLAAARDLDPRLALTFASLSAGMHGYLMLEACGQLGAVFVDLDRAFDAHVRALIDGAGIA